MNNNGHSSSLPNSASIFSEIAGTYGGDHTICMKLSGYHPPNFLGFEKQILSKLELNPAGTYTFTTARPDGWDSPLYFESGIYTLADRDPESKSITLVPDRAQFLTRQSPYSEIRLLTAEEQADRTATGTVKDGTVSVGLHLDFTFPSLIMDVILERSAE
jgi:hypothetical protein